MEKLIELLNEYDEIREYVEVDLEDELISLRIISKWYWFIKRLVENDKIDRDEIIINSDFMPVAFDRKWEKYEWSEEKQLLMLLSISDTPIDDLVSYLKNV